VSVADARRILQQAIARRLFPAAVADVGSSAGSIWRQAFGRLTFDDDAPFAEEATVFDLASLTKVIATVSAIMELLRTRLIELDEPIAASFEDWRGSDRAAVTVRDLLEHTSGLPARLFDAPPAGQREFEHDICTLPLEYVPRSVSVYSDLGFILLGFLVAKRRTVSLASQFEALRARFAADAVPSGRSELLSFGMTGPGKHLAAPTMPLDDDPRRGRRLAGEVHDRYAAVLGGVAGHAGLFGTAAGVAEFARVVLRAARGGDGGPEPFSDSRVQLFATRSRVAGSSRALGWDTMLPTSSCGVHMSPSAFGHVGFTGTSLWIDPVRDRYFVALTNRAFTRTSLEDMRLVRRAFHDALDI
jgi:CubicO group peptidase (beta-lactamase class C family)